MTDHRFFLLPHGLPTARGIILAAAFAACSTTTVGVDIGLPDNARAAVVPVAQCAAESVAVSRIHVARGVSYATRDGRPLQFDVAWSDGGPPAPLVLLLHGGAWSGGSRASLSAEMRALARRGYTAATVEYRLTEAGKNVFPAAVIDVRCALGMLRRRAAEYHIAPERVAAVGYSAGGHLASMLGVGADERGLRGECGEANGSVAADDFRVQAVVSYAGPQDLRVNGRYTRKQAKLVTNFLGVFPGNDPALAALASPIAHVSAGDPPFLLVHGTDDDLVPVTQAWRMAAALREVGTPASVLELRGGDHDFVGLASSEIPSVRCTFDAFLDRWLGNR